MTAAPQKRSTHERHGASIPALLLSALVVLVQDSAVTPFIYALF